MIIEPNSKLVMIGDSITDCERARPIGEGNEDEFGNGYVSYVEGLLGAVYPSHPIRIVNMGVSGNTVQDLENRWQTDVLDLKPHWLSVMIGINDVWLQIGSPHRPEKHILAEAYENTLEKLLKSALPMLKGIVLMTPFFIETNREDEMRKMMDEYGNIVKRVAQRFDAVFVDTQAAIDEVLKHMHPMQLADDRVHPNPKGHMILARAFLKAIGFEWK